MSGGSLRFSYSKNNSNKSVKRSFTKKRCPNRKVYIKGIDHEEGKAVTLILPCNQWHCPVCGPRLYRRLEKRAIRGVGQYLDTLGVNGRRLKYAMKMLTLTWPGRDRRSSEGAVADGVTVSSEAYTGTESAHDAQRLMKKAWNVARTRLQKLYPDLKYFLITEPQTDGYPHFHVLILGSSVIPKSILDDVRRMWTNQYRLGNVDIRIPRWGAKGAVRYVLKYMTDPSKRAMNLPMNCKRYTSSRGLLTTVRKKETGRYTWYEMGFIEEVEGRITGYREMWVTSDERVFYQVNSDKVLKELCDWFDSRNFHVQLPLIDLQ